MITSLFFFVSFLLITNILALLLLGLFLVEAIHFNFFTIHAVIDMIRADWIFYITNADITLAFGLCLNPAPSPDDDDPEKNDKTGFTCSLNDLEKIKANLDGLGGIYSITHIPSGKIIAIFYFKRK